MNENKCEIVPLAGLSPKIIFKNDSKNQALNINSEDYQRNIKKAGELGITKSFSAVLEKNPIETKEAIALIYELINTKKMQKEAIKEAANKLEMKPNSEGDIKEKPQSKSKNKFNK